MAAGERIRAVETRMGLKQKYLSRLRDRYLAIWAAEEIKLNLIQSEEAASCPTDQQLATIRTAAKLVALGHTATAAAKKMGLRPRYLFDLRSRWRDRWQAETELAAQEIIAGGGELAAVRRDELRKKMREVATRLAGGAEYDEICHATGLTMDVIREWQRCHRDLWQPEYDRAMEIACGIVRQRAGTSAVQEDPETFLRGALRAERWARQNNRELFPIGDEPTLGSFYQSYFRRLRLAEAAEVTRQGYECAMRAWRATLP
jgi:hypothetical protein